MFKIIQYPGEYVITLPGTYHQGFNAGFNLAESVNFGSERWREFLPKFKTCDCKSIYFIFDYISYKHAINMKNKKKSYRSRNRR